MKSPISVTQLTETDLATVTIVPFGTTMAESESLTSRHIILCELKSPSTTDKSENFLPNDEMGSVNEKWDAGFFDMLTLTSWAQ